MAYKFVDISKIMESKINERDEIVSSLPPTRDINQVKIREYLEQRKKFDDQLRSETVLERLAIK